MSFGTNLKKIRQDNNLTQEELAKKINTSRSNIANYENDKNMPSIDVLEKLSKVFNCSIDYLLGKSNISNYDKDEQEFRFAYHKEMEGLTDEEIADALRFYKEMKKKVEKNKK